MHCAGNAEGLFLARGGATAYVEVAVKVKVEVKDHGPSRHRIAGRARPAQDYDRHIVQIPALRGEGPAVVSSQRISEDLAS